jgi:uncharacterized protein
MSRAASREFSDLVLVLAFSLSAYCARADLYSASVAYGKKEYAVAFKEYKELAELCQPQAQFNLAAMYANGQGTELSNTSAHAWASLARANGFPSAGAMVDIDIDPVRRLKPYLPEYPIEASRQGIQGEVYVEFVVAADGRARLPRILYAVPGRMFDDYVRPA